MHLLLMGLAWPCDYDVPAISVVPGSGALAAGTVLRVSSDDASGELLDAVSQDTDLEAYPIGQGWTALLTPEDLPEGDYELGLTGYTGSGAYQRRSYSFVAGPPAGGILGGAPALLESTTTLGPDPDANPCDTALAELTLLTMTWSLPSAPELGWVAQLSDSASGATSSFYSLELDAELVRSLVVAQDPDAPVEVCPTVTIWDATHTRVDGWTEACALPVAAGCGGCGGGAPTAGWLGLLAALGAVRRRRA